jgi:hypothetical protein
LWAQLCLKGTTTRGRTSVLRVPQFVGAVVAGGSQFEPLVHGQATQDSLNCLLCSKPTRLVPPRVSGHFAACELQETVFQGQECPWNASREHLRYRCEVQETLPEVSTCTTCNTHKEIHSHATAKHIRHRNRPYETTTQRQMPAAT